MLKNTQTNEEFEILGQVNVLVDEEIVTNYTIVVDGVTETVTIPNELWIKLN